MMIRFHTGMILTITAGSLWFAPVMSGGEVTLAFTVGSNSVAAGEPMRLWLNALNVSGEAVPWTFPPGLARRIISGPATFSGSMALSSPESNSVVIAPGAFVRREYVSTVPDQIAGPVVVEFPGVSANRVALDVGRGRLPDRGTDSAFDRFVIEVEPEERDKGSGPGRFFKEHISAYEPMYFIAGTRSPSTKFQLSFAYQLLNTDGALARMVPALKGLHLAYTQVSLWDLGAASSPFYDTSYKPEVFYEWKNILCARPTNWFELDLQGGLKHESNGKAGADSRSLNIAYLRPTLTLGRDDGLQFSLQPRVWAYLGDLSDNPDIADYRGYADLRAVLGWKRGLQLSALGRMGRDGNHRSLQLDATYPTMRIFGSFSLYLDVQYYYGYGESLLGYDQKTEQLRVGLALFR